MHCSIAEECAIFIMNVFPATDIIIRHQLLQLLFMITLIKSWVKESNTFRSYLLSEYSTHGWTTLSYTSFQPHEEICIDNRSLHELSVIIALATNKTIWKAIASVVAEWWLSWSHIQANFGYVRNTHLFLESYKWM